MDAGQSRRTNIEPAWVSAVLTCNGHEDQLKIVMNIG